MDLIQKNFEYLCNTPSDINEHLPILKTLSKDCTSIAEFGVRGMVSTWAFLHGLTQNNSDEKKLLCVDIENVDNVQAVINMAKKSGVDMKFVKQNSIDCEIPEVDMLFIDTWHIYGHLKRELITHHKKVSKYIVMHDTEVDKEFGESIRCTMNIVEQSKTSGYPIMEIVLGLDQAIKEFLIDNPEWYLYKVYKNNNGLTILKKR